MKGRLLLVLLSASLVACGGSKKPAQSSGDGDEAKPASEGSEAKGDKGDKGEAKAAGEGGEGGEGKSKANLCSGFELDLVAALGHSACELTDVKPTDVKSVDMKKTLDVKVVTSANKVDPGGKVDVYVRFTNKGKDPLTLDFLLDPTARFQIEAYDAKNKRADVPTAKQPPIPMGMPERVAATQSLARVTILPNGTGSAKVVWDAVRMRWAPEKLKGTPPEMGYPRVPSGPLPKGKYTLRVVTPLLNAAEGGEHEVSAPKVAIEVAK